MSVDFYTTSQTGEPDSATWINVSSANGARLLDLLGLPCGEQERYGECDAADFLGRVLTAQALTPADEGVPPHAAVDNPRFIDCGRAPGYTERLLRELATLAREARRRGQPVRWS